MADKLEATLAEIFERALGNIQTRVCVSASCRDEAATPAIAIAYSGGLDSAALLHLAHNYARRHGIQLFAFHIHHGISAHADAWRMHCERECERLGIVFDWREVKIAKQDKNGIEEAARLSRYAALGDLCRTHQVPLLLTAHHQDDQAETVLLQLLRGSGVAGLSGMDTANIATTLLGDAHLLMGRPLLSVSRNQLAEFVAQNNIAYVEDESNADPRYARNALRGLVMPQLEKYFPGFQQRFARSAQHAQSAQRLLVELGAQDLAQCLDGDCLDIHQVKLLSADRADNLLRYWFGSRGVRMPSTAWLSEMRTQLLEAKADAQLCVTHADCHIRRHRDRVYLTPKLNPDDLDVPPIVFRWNGLPQMQFPTYRGTLFFEAAEQGLNAEWLGNQDLSMRYREGGEKLKPAANRPTKSLKYHYQAMDVPAWERERLPLIFADSHLLFAAGIGMDCHKFSGESTQKIILYWRHDSA